MAWQWFNAQVISQPERNYITTALVALTQLYQEASFHDCELSNVTLLPLKTLYRGFCLQIQKHKVMDINQYW